MGLFDLLNQILEVVGLFYGAYSSFKILKGTKTGGTVRFAADTTSDNSLVQATPLSSYDAESGDRLLRFWTVLSFLFIYESFAEWFLSFWIPFYSEIKFGALVWLLLPQSSAPRWFFDRLLHPAVTSIHRYCDGVILPAIASVTLKLSALMQPRTFTSVTSVLSDQELAAWDVSLRSQTKLAAMVIESRRRGTPWTATTTPAAAAAVTASQLTTINGAQYQQFAVGHAASSVSPYRGANPLDTNTTTTGAVGVIAVGTGRLGLPFDPMDAFLLANRAEDESAAALLDDSSAPERLLRDAMTNSPLAPASLRKLAVKLRGGGEGGTTTAASSGYYYQSSLTSNSNNNSNDCTTNNKSGSNSEPTSMNPRSTFGGASALAERVKVSNSGISSSHNSSNNHLTTSSSSAVVNATATASNANNGNSGPPSRRESGASMSAFASIDALTAISKSAAASNSSSSNSSGGNNSIRTSIGGGSNSASGGSALTITSSEPLQNPTLLSNVSVRAKRPVTVHASTTHIIAATAPLTAATPADELQESPMLLPPPDEEVSL